MTAFNNVSTSSFAELLISLGASLVVTTYHANRVILITADAMGVTTDLREFDAPMGVAVGVDKLAIGTRSHVIEYLDHSSDGQTSFLAPIRTHVTGDVGIRELAYDDKGELWAASSKFSCLCTLGGDFSFTPAWTPDWVTELVPEDRCHLNGIGLCDGKVRYATVLGRTNSHRGWKAGQAAGGLLMDVALCGGDGVIVDGLCVPHSPRWENDNLWVLESGRGMLVKVDEEDGTKTNIARVPGFARGLSFAGPFAFVGVSTVRDKSENFEGLPATSGERVCGVWAIDTRTGQTVGWLKFTGAVNEIVSVQVLGSKTLDLLKPDDPRVGTFVKLPRAA